MQSRFIFSANYTRALSNPKLSKDFMKKIFLIFSTILSSVCFSMQKNPQIRTCQTLGGEYLVANSSNDQIGLCKFDKAIVGALDLMLFNHKEAILQSLKTFMKGQTNCESIGQIQTLIVLQGASLQFCSFADGSYIELGTLIKGSHSDDNQKLNQVLGL
jgi:hypothetical protein